MTDIKEQRIRKIVNLYYSKPDIQKAIFSFSKNREVVPRYFEGFGKRPDSFQYLNDVFELVKKGATSFHCSQELWEDPLKISTEMNEKQFKELRIGWDLLLDIDSKYIDYSKILAEQVIELLKFHGVKNFGIKFSGSKGFHIIVPWKAFPKEVGGAKASDMFPEWPRIVTKYLKAKTEKELIERIRDILDEKKYGLVKKYIRREEGSFDLMTSGAKLSVDIASRANVSGSSVIASRANVSGSSVIASRANVSGSNIGSTQIRDKRMKDIERKKVESDYLEKVIPDLILVSPRHLFRTPYSLHEKTALASIVLKPEEIKNFQPIDADPLKAKVREFMPDAEEGEARELLREALDWYKEKGEIVEKKEFEFKPIKLSNLSEKNLPPSIKKILQGVSDGRKRALFILINLFRSVGMEKDELEKRIDDWNKKNEILLKQGYIKSQLAWAYRNKIVPPPNYDKDYYKGIGIIPTEEEIRYKNPVNYVVRKTFQETRLSKKKPKNKDNFKKKN